MNEYAYKHKCSPEIERDVIVRPSLCEGFYFGKCYKCGKNVQITKEKLDKYLEKFNGKK